MSQKVTGNFIGVWQRFRLVLPLLVLLAADPVRAQGVLHGTVRDSTTADELIGVNVSLVGTALGGVTDVDGNYRVASIPSGTYTVRFSYLGYAPREVQVAIASGAFSLTRAARMLQQKQLSSILHCRRRLSS